VIRVNEAKGDKAIRVIRAIKVIKARRLEG
jgi:hypothetical protein